MLVGVPQRQRGSGAKGDWRVAPVTGGGGGWRGRGLSGRGRYGGPREWPEPGGAHRPSAQAGAARPLSGVLRCCSATLQRYFCTRVSPGRAAEMLQARSRLQSWSFQAAWSPGAPGDLKSPPRPQVRHQDLGDPFCPSSQPSLQGGSRASALPVQEMWRRTGHRAFTTNNFL